MIDNELEPIVTMYHWDLPYNLEQLGGWSNSKMIDWFEDYARLLFSTFGDQVGLTLTNSNNIYVNGIPDR